jgi:predicted transcriptional regulator of viral defense system
VPASPESNPSWDRLFELALGQDGHFTTQQAAQSGYSSQLLVKYLKNGRIKRVRRGVYRIVHFPAAEHEDLAAIWLWSEHAGVFSHETALLLHDLGGVLPSKVHLTLRGSDVATGASPGRSPCPARWTAST